MNTLCLNTHNTNDKLHAEQMNGIQSPILPLLGVAALGVWGSFLPGVAISVL